MTLTDKLTAHKNPNRTLEFRPPDVGQYRTINIPPEDGLMVHLDEIMAAYGKSGQGSGMFKRMVIFLAANDVTAREIHSATVDELASVNGIGRRGASVIKKIVGG